MHDPDLIRDALATSTLNHGLMVQGEYWTVAVLRGSFLGIRRFEDWQSRLGIPRSTLANRLGRLVELGLLRPRVYQERPRRHAYHLTQAGLKLYDHVLMIWAWEKRWGARQDMLPGRLLHQPCGQAFVPVLACAACHEKTDINDLSYTLTVIPELQPSTTGSPRNGRIAGSGHDDLTLGLRVDRWSLLIVTAVVLGCHYFDQLGRALGIASGVLARRLAGMVNSGLLIAQPDLSDARRVFYRLTPASRDLFGYLVCFANWASREYLHQPSSIEPWHKSCGKPFVPEVLCGSCKLPLNPREVAFEPATAKP